MKRIFLPFLFVFALSASFAQSRDELEVIQGKFGKEKADLIKQYLKIPVELDAAFWSEYDKYEDARLAIGRDRIALIQDYAKQYDSLDDKQASALMAKKLKIQEESLKLQKKFYDSFSKIIGGRQAAKFFQLEDYLDNVVKIVVADNIPFIDELDNTMKKQ